MKNKFNCFVFVVFLLCFIGCSKQEDKVVETNYHYFIPEGMDIFSVIDTIKVLDLSFMKSIIPNNITDILNEKDKVMDIVTQNDSIFLKNISIFSDDVVFFISNRDTISNMLNIEVSKNIPKGGSIYSTLTSLGMSSKNIGYYAWKMGEFIDATSIDVGDIFSLNYSLDSLGVKHFKKFSYKPDKTSIHEFTFVGDKDLSYNLIELPFELRRRLLMGEITKNASTFDSAMNELGIIPYIRQQANNAMESQIAFSSDARVGDKFKVYIEEKYFQNELQSEGRVLFVEYSGKYTKTKSAYRFDDTNEASAYTGMYTREGKRLVANSVRTPLDRMHVTSNYGWRIHPIYGVRKMHNGLDLRGSIGTNVYAITSGVVIKARDSGGGYGKEVRIRHSNGMISQYAHLHRITTRRNRRVKKGQIIGKVGSTGVSTGPHLHFGIRKGRKWLNPKTSIKMVGANRLSGKRKSLFEDQKKNCLDEMKEIELSKVISDSLSVKS